MAGGTPVIVFARAPRPGRTKTRLVPLLGAAGAARLSERMIEKALATALAARVGPVELHCAPDARHPYFRGLRRRFGVRLRAQGRGGLGARMHRSLRGALREHPAAILVGSDCPALGVRDFWAAARALAGGADAVISPAEDGGYPLVGLRRPARAVFDGVAWSTSRVLAQTLARMRALRWRVRLLRRVWDVDRPEDVARLRNARLLRCGASRYSAPDRLSRSKTRSASRR